MDIFDIWVNLVTERSAQEFVTQEGYENIPGYLGSNQGPTGVDKLLGIMDELGVATGVFTGGLDRNTDKLLAGTHRLRSRAYSDLRKAIRSFFSCAERSRPKGWPLTA